MNDKQKKKDGLEVTSDTLQMELVGIKDRLSAIETIQSISNEKVVKEYVQRHLKTKDARKIMKECEDPKTKADLQTKFGYNSQQALHHHLKPLMVANLLREKVVENDQDWTVFFEWSDLVRGLPKSTIESILGDAKTKK
ncbi:MAG: hypothetical protein Q8922_14940 [Bacteroidota bacterium]|nr:hypothetical protein [Bacteroidota bacterium]MDP4232807.1 hypothetical protein [Bacteroidota bacterium]MDP4242512.1 hypothetical protein [Bacteroidota bacterium]MDP4289213.1 hypothetical protein [Bacteroidota bacterium]